MCWPLAQDTSGTVCQLWVWQPHPGNNSSLFQCQDRWSQFICAMKSYIANKGVESLHGWVSLIRGWEQDTKPWGCYAVWLNPDEVQDDEGWVICGARNRDGGEPVGCRGRKGAGPTGRPQFLLKCQVLLCLGIKKHQGECLWLVHFFSLHMFPSTKSILEKCMSWSSHLCEQTRQHHYPIACTLCHQTMAGTELGLTHKAILWDDCIYIYVVHSLCRDQRALHNKRQHVYAAYQSSWF